MRFGVVVLACMGCGRIAFDAVGDAPLGPFSTPVPVGELNSAVGDDDVSLTADMLEIYFMSKRTGTDDLLVATRTSLTAPWSVPARVEELDTDFINNPKVSPDGLAMVFSSNRPPNAGQQDLWISTRPNRASVWGTPTRIDELATAETDIEPFLATSDAPEIFFDRTVGTDAGIYSATRATPSDPFGNVTELTELDITTYDGGAWVNATRTLLLFHTDRTGSRDIYFATRSAPGETWSEPALWPDINSAAQDTDPWLSPDGRTIYFVSDAAGNDDIYIATR